MDHRFLNPADAERILAEEVQYLHGLWRSGPPPNRMRKASPNRDDGLVHPDPAASIQPNLESVTPQKRGSSAAQNPVPTGEPATGGCGWGDEELDRAWTRPSPEHEPETDGWRVFECPPSAEPSRSPQPLSSEDQAERDTARALLSAVRAAKNYFAQKVKDGEDEDDSFSSDDDYKESNNLDEEEDNAKTRAFKFFIGLFEEDEVLREYYEKKREKGNFACLACAELGVRTTKPYKDCNSLLQHAFSIKKTKRKMEHRALAKAVCRVLGYNGSRLPSMVLAKEDNLGQALAKAKVAQHGVQRDDAAGDDRAEQQ